MDKRVRIANEQYFHLISPRFSITPNYTLYGVYAFLFFVK